MKTQENIDVMCTIPSDRIMIETGISGIFEIHFLYPVQSGQDLMGEKISFPLADICKNYLTFSLQVAVVLSFVTGADHSQPVYPWTVLTYYICK